MRQRCSFAPLNGRNVFTNVLRSFRVVCASPRGRYGSPDNTRVSTSRRARCAGCTANKAFSVFILLHPAKYYAVILVTNQLPSTAVKALSLRMCACTSRILARAWDVLFALQCISPNRLCNITVYSRTEITHSSFFLVPLNVQYIIRVCAYA